MKVSQQIVGVNQRLGNTAVPNMQGTTRAIFDVVRMTAATTQTLTFFQGVSARPYPLSNINTNKFEVGESLAITGISWAQSSNAPLSTDGLGTDLRANLSLTANFTNTLIFNFYIGNQRVVKDLDLNYGRFGIGEGYSAATIKNVFHFETPIVIPPQVEFYATLTIQTSGAPSAHDFCLSLYGQGTLLNTKSNF